ncbi:hypothetical protein PF007_g24994 [Phytophthora fragariae]|uniref:Uncharacterized protein n=1 Tax=Phytophthora fragariae TaxID=53985 RepID=A0A6A3QGF2_9STRA|nr:hypothetical protein PF009_g24722 [Phytophthora fragariae]KAE9075464.1 hypothetical protein PF007_g24994 [Phytophthora fragariae]
MRSPRVLMHDARPFSRADSSSRSLGISSSTLSDPDVNMLQESALEPPPTAFRTCLASTTRWFSSSSSSPSWWRSCWPWPAATTT